MHKEQTGHTGELMGRILRDIDDGVLALDHQGHIAFINPQARALLGLGDNAMGKAYASAFFDDPNREENDAFHQFVLDAAYQKEATHHGVAAYTDGSGMKRQLRITSSFLRDDHSKEDSGVVMVLSDVTREEKLKKQRYDAGVVFACVSGCVCVYLLVLAALGFFGISLPSSTLTYILNSIVLAFALVAYKKTGYTFDDIGLKVRDYKGTFLPALAVCVGLVVVLVGMKLLLVRFVPDFFPQGTPFWNWDLGPLGWSSYLFTSALQEFLARSMVYMSVLRLFDSKRGRLMANVLSCLLFGGIHIAHGFTYMLMSMVLMGSLVGMYEKQRNIWGVSLIHYVLGQTADCLGLLM